MFTSESHSLHSTAAFASAATGSTAPSAGSPSRVRQLCPAGVTPGAPWRNGVVPLVAYVVYTPTHALAGGESSLPARS